MGSTSPNDTEDQFAPRLDHLVQMALPVLPDTMPLPPLSDIASQYNSSAYTESAIMDTINTTDISNITTAEIAEKTFKELFLHSDFGYLALMLIVSIAWVLFITLFSSWFWGFLFSYVVNRLLKPTDGTIWEFSLRSIEISFLAGKVMFGGLQIITQDYRLYINDGYVIFRWWWRYEPLAFEEYFKSSSRLLIYLSGVDYYQYNSYEKFVNLERKYNEKIAGILNGSGDDEETGNVPSGDPSRNAGKSTSSGLTNDEIRRGFLDWRSFLPTIELEAQYVRLVFGNGNAPSLLAASADLFRMRYTVTTASTAVDPLMHVMAGSMKSTRIGFLPSPDYRGGTAERVSSLFEPTQLMPNGYKSMFECERLSFNHYMDQPAEKVHEIVSDVESAASPLMSWGLDLMLSKRAVILYSPWADEQRDLVYRSLSPVDRLPVTPSSLFDRQYESLIVKIKTEDELDLTLSFVGDNKGREECMHMQFGALSWMEIRIPWIIGPAGLTATFVNHIEKFRSSTTMHMSKLVESETLDIKFDIHFPLIWNAPQVWEISLSFSKTTAHLLFYHKNFLNLLFEDWSNQRYADVLRHVPFTIRCRVHFEDFELITFVNEHNWIDCDATKTGGNGENGLLACCGARADLDFQLPFTDFLPDFLLTRVTLTAERIDLKMLLPESNTHYYGLVSLYKSARIRKSGAETETTMAGEEILPISEWSSFTSTPNWMCGWSAGTVSVDINYRFHGLPLLKPGQVLSGPTRGTWRQKLRQLAVDECTVHVTLTNSKVYLSGALIRSIYVFKSNYFGVDDHYTSMQQAQNEKTTQKSNEVFNELLKKWSNLSNSAKNDAVFVDEIEIEKVRETIVEDAADDSTSLKRIREARPIQAYVSLIVRGVEAHLLRHCDDPLKEPPCPTVFIESIHLEVDKKYFDCKVQLVIFPILICVTDKVQRAADSWCSNGQLLLSFLQYRAHGYYSDANMPLGHETCEYAWLQDVQLGDLLGRLSAPQLYELVQCVETLLVFMQNGEDELQRPGMFQECHHMQMQPTCTKFSRRTVPSKSKIDEDSAENMPETPKTVDNGQNLSNSVAEIAEQVCPSADDIKYSMFRLSIDAVQVHISESHAALLVDTNRIWLAQCSLANNNVAGCCNVFVPHAVVKQFVRSNQLSSLNDQNEWLEAGSVDFGAIELVYRMQSTVDQLNFANMQRTFLYEHDAETKRLGFLHATQGDESFCGCYGGCKFFGCHYSPALESLLRPLFRPGHDRDQQLWQGHSLLHAGWNIFPPQQAGIIRALTAGGDAAVADTNVEFESDAATTRRASTNSQQNSRRSSRRHKKPREQAETLNEVFAGNSLQLNAEQKTDAAAAAATLPTNETSILVRKAHVRKMSSISGTESFYSAHSGDGTTRDSSRRSSAQIIPPLSDELTPTAEFSGNFAGKFEPDSTHLLVRRNSTVSSVTISASETSGDHASGIDRILDIENDIIAARVETAADEIENARRFYPQNEDEDNDSLTPTAADLVNAAMTTSSHTTSSSENIDLHHQMTIPVLDSPMLMAGYRSVLSQSQCAFYSFRLFNNNSSALNYNSDPSAAGNVGRLLFSQPTITAVLPIFKSYVRGEAEKFEAVAKKSQNLEARPTNLRSHGLSTDAGDENEQNSQTSIEIFVRSTINIHLTPLSVEAVGICVETLENVVSQYRPLSVLNRMYSLCLSDANKKTAFDENLFMSQRANKLFGAPMVTESDAIVAVEKRENGFCEQISIAAAFSLNVSAISVSFLQVGIADEIVNLSYLDNPLDILCISSLMLGVKSLKLSSLMKSNEKRHVSCKERSVDAVKKPNLTNNFMQKRFRTDENHENFAGLRSAASRTTTVLSTLLPNGASVMRLRTRAQVESSLVSTAGIQYVHLQLRRVLTPGISVRQCNRTQISCISDADSSCWFDSMQRSGEETTPNSFLMMEFGVEQIELQGYRRTGNRNKENDEQNDQNLTVDVEKGRAPLVVVESPPPPPPIDIEQQQPEQTESLKNENYDEDEDVSISSVSGGDVAADDGFSVRIEQEQVVVKIVNDSPSHSPSPPESPVDDETPNANNAEKTVDFDAAQTKPDPTKTADVSSWTMSIGSTWMNLPAAAAANDTTSARVAAAASENSSSSSNDWYFQTTLLPAIWAWLNPCRRFSNVVQKLLKDDREAYLVVTACLMSSALQNRMQLSSQRRSCSTFLLPPLSSVKRQHICLHALALRQDASCRLVRILQKFVFESSADEHLHAEILKALKRENVPSLDVLENGGIAVLLKEWKKQMCAAEKLNRSLSKSGLKSGSSRKLLLNRSMNFLSTNAASQSVLLTPSNVRPVGPSRTAILDPIDENRRAVPANSRRFHVQPNEVENLSSSAATTTRFTYQQQQQQDHTTRYGSTTRTFTANSAAAGIETDADELLQSDLYNFLQHEKQQFMAKPMFTAAAGDDATTTVEPQQPHFRAFVETPRLRRQSTCSLYSSSSSPKLPQNSSTFVQNPKENTDVFGNFAKHIGLSSTLPSHAQNSMTTSGLLQLTKHVGRSCKVMLSLNELKLQLIESCVLRPTERNLSDFQRQITKDDERRKWCAFTSGGFKCDARLSTTLAAGDISFVRDQPTITLYYAVTLGKVMQAVDLATLRVLLQVVTLVSKMMNEPRYAAASRQRKRGSTSAAAGDLDVRTSRSSSRRRRKKQATSVSGGGISPAVSISSRITPPVTSSISGSTITPTGVGVGDGRINYADNSENRIPNVAVETASSSTHAQTPQCWKRLYFLLNSSAVADNGLSYENAATMLVNEQQQDDPPVSFRQASFSQRFRRRPTKGLIKRAATAATAAAAANNSETAFGREISVDSAAAGAHNPQNSSFFAQPFFHSISQNSAASATPPFDVAAGGAKRNYSQNLLPLVLNQTTKSVLNVSGSVRLEAIQLNANVLGLNLSIAMEDCNVVPTYCMLQPKNATATSISPHTNISDTVVNTLSVSININKLMLRLLENDDDEITDRAASTSAKNAHATAAGSNRGRSILSIRIGPCSANYSKAYAKHFGTLKNVASLGIAAIRISLPQNPALVHSLMTKRSENLTTTIDELRKFTTVSGGGGGGDGSETAANNEADTWVAHHPNLLDENEHVDAAEYYYADATETVPNAEDALAAHHRMRRMPPRHGRPSRQISAAAREDENETDDDLPVLVNAQIRELRIESSVLPSLKAVYHMPEALVFGLVATNHASTDSSASVDIPQHSLSFVSKVNTMRQYNLAPSARFDLPDLTVSVSYGPAPYYEALRDASDLSSIQTVRANGLLKLFVTIGSPEYRITTDLLNYVILIQRVFMQELRDLVEKISAASSSASRKKQVKPKKAVQNADLNRMGMHRSRSEPNSPNFARNRPQPPPFMPKVQKTRPNLPVLLFQVQVQQEALRILASTTTGSAVRLDTSRLAVISTNIPSNAAAVVGGKTRRGKKSPPVLMLNEFGSVRLSAQIDVMLALGQLVKSEKMVYEEAEPDFQPMALFKSRLQVSNHVVTVRTSSDAGADVTTPSTNSKRSHDIETPVSSNGTTNTNSGKQESRVLAVLQHPYLYAQPRAADTALWFYFNYRSAYQSFISQRERVDQQKRSLLMLPPPPTTVTSPSRFPIDPKDVAFATLRRKSSISANKKVSLAARPQRSVDAVVENAVEEAVPAAASSYTAVVFQFLVYQAQICVPLQSTQNPSPVHAARSKIMLSADAEFDGGAGLTDVDDVDDDATCYSPALLISLNSARVKALWTDENVITTGQFDKFTMHFSDDQWGCTHFEHIIDPSMLAVLEVPHGTAQLCSRSVSEQRRSADRMISSTFAKWFVQIKWNMHGIVLNIDTNVGRNVSALVETLASMANKQIGGGGQTTELGTDAGGEDQGFETETNEKLRMAKQKSVEISTANDEVGVAAVAAASSDEIFSDALTDPAAENSETNAASKNRAQLEREMVQRASRLQHLMRGTTESDQIEAETRRLHKIEAQLSYDVRRDVFGRLTQSNAQRTTAKTDSTTTPDAEKNAPEAETQPNSRDFCTAEAEKPSKSKSSDVLPSSEQQQPHVDLDLAVIMLIDSGKCNFYMRQVVSTAATDSKKRDSTSSETTTKNKTQQNLNKLQLLKDRLKLGRNNTAKTSVEAEAAEKHRRHAKRSSMSSTHTAGTLGGGSSGFQMQEQLTSTLHLPGITMRAHYKSQNNAEIDAELQRSSLHAVMTLLSMPEETRVSPKMLDFVEQVLQRLGYDKNQRPPSSSEKNLHAPKRSLSETGTHPTKQQPPSLTRENSAPPAPSTVPSSSAAKKSTVLPSKSVDDAEDLGAGGVLVADNTFPIDVYFCLKVQPSVIRCFCEPVSKVQALVKLPSFEVMLSSRNSSANSKPNFTAATGAEVKNDDDFDGDDEEADLHANDAVFKQPSKKSRRNLPIWAERLQNAATVSRNDESLRPPFLSPSGAAEIGAAENSNSILSTGGISATAVISDFALIIFHPYGTMPPPPVPTVGTNLNLYGGKNPTGNEFAHRSETFASFGTAASGGGGGGSADFGIYTTRKELLRLQVDAIRIHLSRWKAAKQLAATKIDRKILAEAKTVTPVRFTCMLNIGKTSFQYDMRRLPEIMAFPKAFYRKSILRRFFLGDESATSTKIPTKSEREMPKPTSSSAEKSKNSEQVDVAGGLGTIAEQDESSAEPNSARKSPHSAVTDATTTKPTVFFSEKTAVENARALKNSKSASISAANSVLTWKTLVSVSLNISAIDVHMNIGNVLGATLLSIENLSSLGRFSAASDGHRNMYVSADCHRLLLESKGGIIGTLCTLVDLEAFGHVQRDARQEPRNMCGFKFRRLETRFDYMAATSMMMRLSNFELTAADKWNIAHLAGGGARNLPKSSISAQTGPSIPIADPDPTLNPNPNFTTHFVSPPSLHINTSASWDQFQVILCSTSTTDMVRAIYKLREFGREQVVSGRKFIVSVTGDTTTNTAAAGSASAAESVQPPVKEPRRTKKSPAPAMPTTIPAATFAAAAASAAEEEARAAALMHDPYHRYWPRPLKLCAGKCVKTLIDCVFPTGGTVLGGTCEMSGQHMSIACFYGSSFRAKSWARFSIKSPQATFNVEAHEAMNDETKRQEYHIVQNLAFRLGKDEQSRYASTVARVSCQGSPAVKSFHEWFAFVFHDSELDEVHRFPKSDQENSLTNIHLFKHVKIISEMILGLPRVDVNLRTEHWHTLHVPVENPTDENAAGSERPKVIVNFMTDFGAPISIDMGDSQAFYFLHQLIQSYLSMGTENGNSANDADSGHFSSGGTAAAAAGKKQQQYQKQTSLSEAGTSTGSGGAGKFVPLPTDLLKVDKRLFECRQWYMEPQVKLLQRIGRDIEPYGVDRVLQRLGFEHARSTIPKWIQRGVLDPLDSLTAAVATQLILRNMRKPPSN